MPKYFKSASVRVKDKNGKYVMIPALRAPSGYEIAKEKGFTGTEEEWLELMIGDGWISAYQEIKAETERLEEVKINTADVVSTETKTALGLTKEATPAEAIAKMYDISSAHLSNRAPTENDAAAPGKVWMVPYMRFNNLVPHASYLRPEDWSVSGGTRESLLIDSSMIFTGNGNAASLTCNLNMLSNVAKGHKVFISAKVTAVTAANNITLKLVGSDGSTIKSFTANVPDAGKSFVWKALVNSSDNLSKLVLSSTYNSAATQKDQRIKIERIFVLDLTDDMSRTTPGLEFTEKEVTDYTSNASMFNVQEYDLSNKYWVSRGNGVWGTCEGDTAAIAPYTTFVGNANANMISSAFGQNNEGLVAGIGKALSMYAKFKQPWMIDDTYFSALNKCDSLQDIIDSGSEAIMAVLGTMPIYSLVVANAYAKTYFDPYITDNGIKQILCDCYNINANSYADLPSLLSDTAKFSLFSRNEQAVTLIFLSTTAEVLSAIFNNQTNVNSIYHSYHAVNAINKHVNLSSIISAAKNSTLKTTKTTLTEGWNTLYTGKCIALRMECGGSGERLQLRTGLYTDITWGLFNKYDTVLKDGDGFDFFSPIKDKLELHLTYGRSSGVHFIPVK